MRLGGLSTYAAADDVPCQSETLLTHHEHSSASEGLKQCVAGAKLGLQKALVPASHGAKQGSRSRRVASDDAAVPLRPNSRLTGRLAGTKHGVSTRRARWKTHGKPLWHQQLGTPAVRWHVAIPADTQLKTCQRIWALLHDWSGLSSCVTLDDGFCCRWCEAGVVSTHSVREMFLKLRFASVEIRACSCSTTESLPQT